MTDETSETGHTYPPPHDNDTYGFMERELAFKLLASHAMVDAEFFDHLHDDPEGAAKELHIYLDEDDINYIKNQVDWEYFFRYEHNIREALKLELVTNSW